VESEAVERCAEVRKHRFCNRSNNLAPWECLSVFPVSYGLSRGEHRLGTIRAQVPTTNQPTGFALWINLA
jgi:hypothetical protein